MVAHLRDDGRILGRVEKGIMHKNKKGTSDRPFVIVCRGILFIGVPFCAAARRQRAGRRAP